MKIISSIIFILIFVTVASAQSTFQKVFSGMSDDRGNSIVQVSSGGYALAGSTNSFGAGGYDLTVIKTDILGNVLWQKAYGGPLNEQVHLSGNTINEISNNSFLLTCKTESFGAGVSNPDMLILKIDQFGNIVWSRKLGESFNETPKKIIELNSLDILLPTTANQVGFGASDAGLIKMDNLGNTIWQKYYGGPSNDHFHDVIELPNGDFIAIGNTFNFGPADRNFMVVRIDALGNIIWSKAYGGNNWENSFTIKRNNNHIYIGGGTESFGAGGRDFYLSKLDLQGNIIWTYTYGTADDEVISEIEIINNNALIVNGQSSTGTQSKLVVFKVDTNGTLINSVEINTASGNYFSWNDCLGFTNDNGFVITGWGDSWGPNNDLLLVKSDSLWTNICSPITLSAQLQTSLEASNGISVMNGSLTNQVVAPSAVNTLYNSSDICFCPLQSTISPTQAICFGDSTQLIATGGSNFQWSPATGLSCTSCPNPIASPAINTTYTVIVSDTCGSDTNTVFVKVLAPLNTSLSSDTSICQGSTAQLLANGGSNYQWFPSTGLSCTTCPNPIASPTATTTYSVIISDSCNSTTDSVTVSINNIISTSITSDTLVCPGDSVQLNATGGFNFLWSPTTSLSCTACPNPVAYPTSTTNYSVIITDSCGIDTISVTVSVNTTASITGFKNYCVNSNPVTLIGSPPNGFWSGTAISPTGVFNPEAAGVGTHQIIYQTSGTCSSSDTIYINVHSAPSIDLGSDTTICSTCFIILDAGTGFNSYLWSTGANSQTIQATQPGLYYVSVNDSLGCNGMDTIYINKESCESYIYFPNVFTPNADNLNELFTIPFTNINEYHILIYNRWGFLVFESKNPREGWNGEFKNRPVPEGVYIATVAYTDCKNRKHLKRQHITLLR